MAGVTDPEMMIATPFSHVSGTVPMKKTNSRNGPIMYVVQGNIVMIFLIFYKTL